MIIQCEQCRTKFKLDDSKVPDKGVRVRCVKCRHVFSVAKDQSGTEFQADFGTILDSSVASSQDTVEVQEEYAVPDEASAIEFEDSSDSSETVFEQTLGGLESAPFEMEDEQEPPLSAGTNSADQTLFSLSEDSIPPVQIEEEDTAGDIDFGEFAFNEDNDEAGSTASAQALDFSDAPTIQPPPVESKKEEFGGLDFSGDDMFGEVVPAAPEETDDAVSFDFGMNEFSSSMGVDDTAASPKNAFAIADSSSDTPFSLDEIDFGDEFTSVGVQHVSPEELKPSQELLFAPLAEAQAKPSFSSSSETAASQEELPPLSIASRRKQSPLSTALIAVLGIIIAGAVAFFGYSMFTGDKANLAEIGHISIHEVDATFVKNKLTGDLLVISGEAVNDFNTPRASIQVKGMVYGANGDVISSKNAFCGNPLTEEQLSTMTMEKIEAAMANQFGDSLANMEVPPGKSIPFVIVIPKPSAGAKDYGVEPAGSTVSTGKLQ